MTETPAEQDFDTWYDRFGGEPFFTELVHGFYQRVALDEKLRPMYPEADLGPAEERLRLFLMQYWGGPKTYGEQRGHPRLRMRHAPFAVTFAARDRWLQHMDASLTDIQNSSLALDDIAHTELWTYLTSAADAMVNQNPALQG